MGSRVLPNPSCAVPPGNLSMKGLPRMAPLVDPTAARPVVLPELGQFSPLAVPSISLPSVTGETGRRGRVDVLPATPEPAEERKGPSRLFGSARLTPARDRFAGLDSPPSDRGPANPFSSTSASSSSRRRSSIEAQATYKKMAREKCEEYKEKAAAIMKERENRPLPPGVWWGFHHFWPERLLNPPMEDLDPMENPEFLEKVMELMNDERMVDTFAIFDADGSGTISSEELGGLVQMLVPNPHPLMVKEMVKEMDMNSDGEIDLWEFCVHMQKRIQGITNADVKVEIDQAFDVFTADAAGCINEDEMRRVLCDPEKGTALEPAEMAAFLDDLAARGLNLRGGGRIRLQQLREHPCYQVDDETPAPRGKGYR